MGDDGKNLDLAHEVGRLTGKIDLFVTTQMGFNDRVTTLLERHEEKDDTAHKDIEKDISSLKTSRKVQRAVIATSAIGTPAAAAKMGWLGKILAAIAGAGAAGGSG